MVVDRGSTLRGFSLIQVASYRATGLVFHDTKKRLINSPSKVGALQDWPPAFLAKERVLQRAV